MKKTAVIMGGGFAGMCCAQVLSRYFDKTILIESNEFSPAKTASPQSHHLHALMQQGRATLERIFPGVDQRLAARGCQEIDWAQDTLWISRKGVFPRYQSNIVTRSTSRYLLEETMRDYICGNEKIEIVDGFRVSGFKTAEGIIQSIQDRAAREISGDLFVNALGRQNPLNDQEDFQVSPLRVYYTSCIVKSVREVEGYKQIYVQMMPAEGAFGAVISPIEDGMHLLTILSRDSVPFSTVEEIQVAISKVACVHFREALANVEFLSSPRKFCHAKGIRRHCGDGPKNLLTVGDAKCLFNPLYGQGMTLAALEAATLGKLLAKGIVPTQRSLKHMDTLPWLIASSEDSALLLPHSSSALQTVRLFGSFFNFILTFATKSKTVHKRLLEVLHMLRPVDKGLFATLRGLRR